MTLVVEVRVQPKGSLAFVKAFKSKEERVSCSVAVC